MVRRSSETNTPMELHGKTIALYGLLVFLVLISATEPAPSTITAKRFWLCLFKNTLRRFASLDGKVTPGICDDISVKGSNIGQVSYPSKHSSTTAASHLRSRRNSEGSNADKCHIEMIEARWFLKNVTVRFQKFVNGSDWYVNISWTPLISENAFLWTGYYVIFSVGNEEASGQFCLPKNRTNVIVSSEDGWYYPKLIYLNVTAIPRFNKPSNKTVPVLLYSHDPKTYGGTTFTPLDKYDEKGFDEPGPNKSLTYVAIGIASLVGLGLVVGLSLYVWRYKKLYLYHQTTNTMPSYATANTTSAG